MRSGRGLRLRRRLPRWTVTGRSSGKDALLWATHCVVWLFLFQEGYVSAGNAEMRIHDFFWLTTTILILVTCWNHNPLWIWSPDLNESGYARRFWSPHIPFPALPTGDLSIQKRRNRVPIEQKIACLVFYNVYIGEPWWTHSILVTFLTLVGREFWPILPSGLQPAGSAANSPRVRPGNGSQAAQWNVFGLSGCPKPSSHP